jgi:hypothetical protein
MHGMGDMGGMMQQCAAMMPSVEPDGDRKDKQE